MNRTTGVVILASVALAAVAIIVAAYLFTHKPEAEASSAEASSVFDQNTERWHEERVTCLEDGGIWVHGGLSARGTCGYSSVESAAPVVERPRHRSAAGTHRGHLRARQSTRTSSSGGMTG